MRFRTSVRVLLGFAIIIGVVSVTYAQSISECQALITALRVKTESVAINGNNADKDRAGLVGKLNEAAIKLDQAKFCDAIQKLNDFKLKVQELAAAGKIGFEDANQLSGDADKARECVLNVATSSGTACGG